MLICYKNGDIKIDRFTLKLKSGYATCIYVESQIVKIGTNIGQVFSVNLNQVMLLGETSLKLLYPTLESKLQLKEPVLEIHQVKGENWIVMVYSCLVKIVSGRKEFPMVLIPEGLGSITQSCLLEHLKILVVSSDRGNHAYIDLNPLVVN